MDAHWGSVVLGHEHALENDGIEFRVGTAGKEPVELNEQLEVDVVRLGVLLVRCRERDKKRDSKRERERMKGNV